MSIQRHGDGLFWPSLFSISERKQKGLIDRIKNSKIEYSGQLLAMKMLECFPMQNQDHRSYNLSMQIACERVALKFMLCDSDFAKDMLSCEDYEKACDVYARKQYNSKLLKNLLCIFLSLLTDVSLNGGVGRIQNIFILSIMSEYRVAEQEEISRSFGELKKTIEKVASGVKNICYYETERVFNYGIVRLNDELNRFALAKTNYDFNKAVDSAEYNQRSTLFSNKEHVVNNNILQLALVNDIEFWEKHKNFNIVIFLKKIVEHNDLRHAEKVLAFILDNLQKMPNMNIVFENNLPLYMSRYEELVESLEDQAFRFAFKRLEAYCDINKVSKVPLCYPMSKVDPSFIEIGKKVWERFISLYNYPKDYEQVNRYISEEIKHFVKDGAQQFNDVAIILDSAPFRYSARSEDRRVFSAYHPDCFSFDNIWNRVYLKAYAVTLLSDDENKQFSYLQRIFVDLIKTIEERTQICTAHQMDTSTRDKHYLKLKKMLSVYGIDASDENKSNYIIALLDRDTALLEEAEVFPMLEQVGDAIYGLAVAELLFFNPDSLFYPEDKYDPYGKNIEERFEKFKRAEAQVLIAKKHKIDELYLQIGLPSKSVEYDSIFFNFESLDEEKIRVLNREKYLADSLEMIIGAVFVDKGVDCALRFTKQLLRETYPEHFSREVHIEERTEHDENIDWEYWVRILSGPYSELSVAHRVMWNALDKAVLATCIGTDDKDKRRFITYSFGNKAVYGEKDEVGVSWPLFYYLRYGLNFVLQKYGDIIRKKYSTNNKFN